MIKMNLFYYIIAKKNTFISNKSNLCPLHGKVLYCLLYKMAQYGIWISVNYNRGRVYSLSEVFETLRDKEITITAIK